MAISFSGVPFMQMLALLLQDFDQTRRIATVILTMIPLIAAVFLIILIIPFWCICKKAGFSPWLSLLVFVPFGVLILLYVLAFAGWKVVPVPQMGYVPSPPYPPQPPLPPQSPQTPLPPQST
jgi:phosphatidylserine synthase